MGLRVWKLPVAVIGTGALGWSALCMHPFLAVTEPVEADVIVLEGWAPPYVADRAAQEFARGGYRRLFVSGMHGPGAPSDASVAIRRLAERGLDVSKVVDAATPASDWNRTSTMARAVRDRVLAEGIVPRGVNVVTLGPHARQSRLAFSRMFGPNVSVGVISVPKDDYEPARWWASLAGVRKTTKDFAGWLRESLFGLRA